MPAKRLTEADVVIRVTERPMSAPVIGFKKFMVLVNIGCICLGRFDVTNLCKSEDDYKRHSLFTFLVAGVLAELQVRVDELYALIHVEVSLEDRLKKIEWSDSEDHADHAGD